MDSFDFDHYAYRDNESNSKCSDYDKDDSPDIVPLRDSSLLPPIHRAIGITFILIILQSTESITRNQKHKEEYKKIKEEHYIKHL